MKILLASITLITTPNLTIREAGLNAIQQFD